MAAARPKLLPVNSCAICDHPRIKPKSKLRSSLVNRGLQVRALAGSVRVNQNDRLTAIIRSSTKNYWIKSAFPAAAISDARLWGLGFAVSEKILADSGSLATYIN